MSDGYTLSLGGLEVQWDEPTESGATITLRGEMDSASVPVLRQALDRIYAAGCHDVRVDLRGLDFIDSSGLGALVGAWRTCHEHDGSVVAVDPTATVRQLMDMTGISRFLLPA